MPAPEHRFSEPTTTPSSGDWNQTHTAPPPGQATPRAPAETDGPRRLRMIPVLVAINVAVFLVWQLARGDEQLAQLMFSNFLVSPGLLARGHVWTLLTSAFSHFELWHLALNMFVLFSFGRVLESMLGWRRFLLFYLAAAVFSSASHCAVTMFVLHRGDIPALGASGAVSAVLIAVSLLLPRAKVLLFFVLPIPALVGALLFVAIDIWGLVAQGRGVATHIGHGAHLGGALCGAVFYLTTLRPLQKRAQAAYMERRLPLDAGEVAEVMRLRAKLARKGAASLTEDEHEFMRRVRAKLDQAAAREQDTTPDDRH